MSKLSAVINPIVFDKQIPVTDINADDFKDAIQDKKVKCLINGARVNNPFTKGVNVDISFKILDDLDIMTPGTSITGKPIYKSTLNDDDTINVIGKNVTLNFDVAKNHEKGVIEIFNTHELYSIFADVLKSNNKMGKSETGSIKLYYSKINSYLENNEVFLTTINVISSNGLEVNAIPGSETQ